MPKLPSYVREKIETEIDKLFERLKLRYLGPNSVDKSLFIGWDWSKDHHRQLSLPGIYEEAVKDEGGIPDLETYHSIMRTAGNYIDATKERAKAQVITRMTGFVNEFGDVDETKKLLIALEGSLSETWGKVGKDVQRIIDTENSTARNVGLYEGIERVNASMGIEDPTIVFLTVRDMHRCKECERLHLLKDLITPRAWKLSQVSHDYHKKGNPYPSIHGLHPNCRCSMTTILPGFGFDEGGRVTWIKDGYDVYAEQHKLGKSETIEEPLQKSTPLGIRVFETLAKIYALNPSTHKADLDSRNVSIPSEALVDHFLKSPITVNLPERAVKGLLEHGRFRNLFETGDGEGSTDQNFRAQMEHDVLGIPLETSPEERPIYGALHYNHGHISGARGGAGDYGPFYFVLKDDIKNRASLTPDDSFGSEPHLVHLFTPEGVRKIIRENLDRVYRGAKIKEIEQELLGHSPRSDNPTPSYIEAQIHGGIYLDRDVAEFHVAYPSWQKFAPEQLEVAVEVGKRYGIPVFYHAVDEKKIRLPPEKIYDPLSDSSDQKKQEQSAPASSIAANQTVTQ